MEPGSAGFSAESGIVKYYGFSLPCKDGIVPSYQPIEMSISVYCCQNVVNLMVGVLTLGNGKRKHKQSYASWYVEGDRLKLRPTLCDSCGGDPIFDEILVSEYQRLIEQTFREANSVDGFNLNQTLFWDLNPAYVCFECEERECPVGMIWDAEACKCVPEEECLDTRAIKLIAKVTPIPAALNPKVRYIKRSKVGDILIDEYISLPITEFTLATYRSNEPIGGNFINWLAFEYATIVLNGALELSLVEFFGPAGIAISEVLSLELKDVKIKESDCCTPPEEGCPSGFYWDNEQCECVKPPVCPPGTIWNSVLKQCMKCPPGTIYNPTTGLCESCTQPIGGCGPNSYWDAARCSCIPIPDPPEPEENSCE